MKTQAIKIPDSTADMNMSHLPFFFALSQFEDRNFDDLTPIEVADMLVIFFNSKNDEFDKYTHTSNKRLFAEICKSCSKHKSEPLKKDITINGTKYVLISDFSSVNVAFHRDIANCDFQENPLDLLAFCYLEEGLTYNQLDKSEKIINPRRERGEAFRNHITLSQYLDLQSFFLSSYPVLKRVSRSQRLTGKSESLSKSVSGIGKSQSTT